MNVRSRRRVSRATAPIRPVRRTCIAVRRAAGLFLATLVAVMLGVSCSSAPPATPAVLRTIPPTQAPAAPTETPTPAEAAEPEALTLIWWTPEFLSPQAPQPAGSLLAQQLTAFTEAQSGKVRIEAVRKARYGKGGLLDALRTAQPVARQILPDMVALDAAELGQAVEAGLLQRVDELIDASVTEKLYPFASEAGLFRGQLYGVQYLADIDHVAYLPTQVAEAPGTWADLLARQTAYLFPMAPPQTGSGQSVAARPVERLSNAVLGQYLSAGATLGPDRRVLLEPQPLLRLLTFYADGTKTGLAPPAARELADGDAVWNVFSQGQAPLAYVSARRYIGRGDLFAGYAPPLGYQESAVSIASGWVLAIVTPDLRRQRAAADFIAWLLKPENAGAWAARGGWLPTSSDALKALGTDAYWSFLDAQLAKARALPAGPESAMTATRIQAAIEAVVSGQADAQAATDGAVNGQ